MGRSETLERLLQKWGEMISAANPSAEPIILAGIICVVIFIVLSFLNIRAILRIVDAGGEGKKISAMAVSAWILSIISPWLGPLALVGVPVSFFIGFVAWIRLPTDEILMPPQPSSHNASARLTPTSNKYAVIPARMAMVNSIGVTVQLGLILAALYVAFGSVLRDILWEMWQYKSLFRDYIVT